VVDSLDTSSPLRTTTKRKKLVFFKGLSGGSVDGRGTIGRGKEETIRRRERGKIVGSGDTVKIRLFAASSRSPRDEKRGGGRVYRDRKRSSGID